MLTFEEDHVRCMCMFNLSGKVCYQEERGGPIQEGSKPAALLLGHLSPLTHELMQWTFIHHVGGVGSEVTTTFITPKCGIPPREGSLISEWRDSINVFFNTVTSERNAIIIYLANGDSFNDIVLNNDGLI